MGFYLPTFKEKLGWSGSRTEKNQRIEERTELLALMMALYPFVDTSELAEEFQMSEKQILQVASYNGVRKSELKRKLINIENGRDAFLRKKYGELKNRKVYEIDIKKD